MDLSGQWRAAIADEDLRRSAIDADYDDSGWAPLSVPGHWRSNPAFDGSDGPLLYRHRFDHHEAHHEGSDGARWWLVLEGCFYQGDVWLDGSYLGDTEGYFFPHVFEITEELDARREHVLAVELSCSPARTRTAKRNITGVFQHHEAIDPAWNPGGIWRPVSIQRTGPVRIARLRVLCGEADDSRAVVRFRAELSADDARTVSLRTRIGDRVENVAEHSLAAGANAVEWTVTVDRPQLWWPWALGNASLQDVSVSVELDAGVSDTRRLRTGLRQVSMHNWTLSVNGERMFCKGARLAPTRAALAEAEPEELRMDIELAREAGLDMVRMQAHVSRPEIYDAADEAGMLIWQDLPLTWGYARNIRRQATRQATEMVDMLGHHPSIALWCGHDSPHNVDTTPGAAPAPGRLTARQQLPTWNKTLLDNSVKRALATADRTRPVIAHSGVAPHLPQLDGTDTTLWLGWSVGDERELPALLRTVPRLGRFVTGLGSQAAPEDADFCQPERWPDLDWEGLEAHHGLDHATLAARVPTSDHDSFDSWARATQAYQSMVLRRQIEVLRRLKYHPTGGFAYALLADPWPAISMSVLDHRRRAKTGYQALADACRPVIVVADRLPAAVRPNQSLGLDVHVVSDLREILESVRVTARLGWRDGEHTWSWEGSVPADSCVRVGTISIVVPEAYGPLSLDLDVATADRASSNRYHSMITT